jgi:hypothetical protein
MYLKGECWRRDKDLGFGRVGAITGQGKKCF